MINLCICDDNKNDVNKLKALINKAETPERIHIKVFESGESLLFHCDEDINFFSIIFMDIEMNKLNGIQTMIKMRKKGYVGDLIYLTSFKEYVFDSFDTMPINYFLKWDNIDEKLIEILSTAFQNISLRKKIYISITTKKSQILILKKEIMYIESDKRKVLFHLINKRLYDCYAKLGEIHEMLSDDIFIRIHKSYIVNFDYIKGIEDNTMILNDDTRLPISRMYIQSVKKTIADLI
ncbi:LytR/AlgR family response regulator transcription factor [Eubacterium sp.]|uniref:LytR/AlgR family response regulator transcription factor n=1 Tax=Eubacterium sp. TaxID=142586 RepID=UPI002FC7A41E